MLNESAEFEADDLLSIAGGPPVRREPFPKWPVFDEEIIEAVADVLRSGRVNCWTGEQVRLFEEEFAKAVGACFAVAVANGTVAIELALEALGVGPGDEVIVPSRTFIATASAVVMRGAIPVVADIDSQSQNVTAETIRAVITKRTKGIIVVHLAGWPCDMDAIMELAQERGLKVIEDCAQAHGAAYKGRPVGSFGHAAAFSFCQDKIISTGGEGGMLTTNDKTVWERAWSFKDHGKSWHAVHRQTPGTVFKWLHENFGTNWRMTEMQAAIGRIMVCRLPEWVKRRRQNAALLSSGLLRLPSLRVVVPDSDFAHSYYKYYAFLQSKNLLPGWSRDRIVLALQAEGIPCGSGACAEIYCENAFIENGLQLGLRLPTASNLGEESLMFLVHPTLSAAEMRDTCRAVEKVLCHTTTSFDASTRPRNVA